MRFSRHVAWTLIARILIAGGSLLAGVIVARWLGAAALGVLASLSVMTLLAVTFGGLGLPSAITFLVARGPQSLMPAMVNSVVSALAIGGVLAFGIVFVANVKPDLFGGVPARLVMITAVAIPFHMLTLFCLAVFLGRGSMNRYNLLDLLSQAFLVVNPVVVLAALGLGLLALVTSNAVTAVLLSILILTVLLRTAGGHEGGGTMHFDAPLMAAMLRHGSKFYVAMAASVIIFRADLLIVNYFRGSAEAGVYAISTQVGTLLMLIPNVISTVLFPRVTEARDDGEMTCRVTRHASLIMLVVCLAAVPLAFLLPILYGPAFADVPFQVLILLPGVFLLGIEAVQVQYFSSLGLPRAIPLFWLAAMAVNITLNLILIPSFGANAAAVVSTFSYALMFLLVAIYFRSHTGRSFSEAFLIRTAELRELLCNGKLFTSAREGKA